MHGNSRNVGVIYYLKENREKWTFRSNGGKLNKIKWESSNEKLKERCDSSHTEKECVTFTQKKRKKCFTQSATIAVFTVNTNGAVPQTDKMFQAGETKEGKEFIETYRGCQELRRFPVRKYYF